MGRAQTHTLGVTHKATLAYLTTRTSEWLSHARPPNGEPRRHYSSRISYIFEEFINKFPSASQYWNGKEDSSECDLASGVHAQFRFIDR